MGRKTSLAAIVLIVAVAVGYWLIRPAQEPHAAGESEPAAHSRSAAPSTPPHAATPAIPAPPTAAPPLQPSPPPPSPGPAAAPATASPGQPAAPGGARPPMAGSNPAVTPAAEPPPEAPPIEDLVKNDVESVALNLRHFGQRFGGNPVGTNAEIVKALTGDNEAGATYLSPDLSRLNANGELIDRWGTPYFFHQISATETEVRSAGPDLILWNQDDVIAK